MRPGRGGGGGRFLVFPRSKATSDPVLRQRECARVPSGSLLCRSPSFPPHCPPAAFASGRGGGASLPAPLAPEELSWWRTNPSALPACEEDSVVFLLREGIPASKGGEGLGNCRLGLGKGGKGKGGVPATSAANGR